MLSSYLRTFALVLVCCFFSTILRSQWLRSPGPIGGAIGAFYSHSSGLYAGSGDYTAGDLYVSTDRGTSWHSFGENLPIHAPIRSLAVGKNEIYAGTARGLFYSGTTGPEWWTIDTLFPNAPITQILISDSDVVIAASGFGLFRTTDHAAHWSPLGFTASKANTVNGLWRHGALMLASTRGRGVFRSTDAGATWTDASSGLATEDLYSYGIAEHKGVLFLGTLRTIYRSTDEGQHWTATGTGLPDMVGASAIVTDGTTLYAKLDSYGVWSSTDDGATWKPLHPGVNDQLFGFTMHEHELYAGYGREGVAKWGSDAWHVTGAGVTSVSVYALRSFEMNGVPTLYAGTLDADFGLAWHSEDHSETWHETPRFTTRGLHDFEMQSGVLFAATDGEGIFRSTDNGASWHHTQTPAGTEYTVALAATPSTLIAGASGFSVYTIYSSDNGATWQPSETMPTRAPVHIFYDSVSHRAFATLSIGLATSTDDGHHWTMASGTMDTVVLSNIVRSGSRLFAGYRHGLLVSKDDGATWDTLASPLSGSRVTALTTSRGVLFAAMPHEVFFSTDDGDSWLNYDDIVLPGGADIITLAADDSRVYAGLAGIGVWWSEFTSQLSVHSSTSYGSDGSLISVRCSTGASGEVTVTYTLERSAADVAVTLYDAIGRTLTVSREGERQAGEYRVRMQSGARSGSHGGCFVAVTANGMQVVRPVMLP